MEWTDSLPKALRRGIWQTPPHVLSDQRFAPNLQLREGPFHKGDTTATALVSLFGKASVQQTDAKPAEALRHSYLPDDAAGVFDPGWDVSRDELPDGTVHLAAYGLGSPFPEDAKLCAALSTFWPAAAPDATRAFEPRPDLWPPVTVSPLTDEEIGKVGGLPWDGIHGPQVIANGNEQFVEYASFAHVDYVQSALDGKFSVALTSHIGVKEYQARVISIATVYRTLGLQKSDWLVLSFQRVTAGDPELLQAQQQAQTTLPGDVYRFEVFRNGTPTTPQNDFRKRWIKIKDPRILFVAPDVVAPGHSRVLVKKQNSSWVRG